MIIRQDSRIEVVRNKNWKMFLLLTMIKLFETNRISHFPAFYDDFSLQKFNFKNWIFYSALICGPKLCKRDGIIKTRLAIDIDSYPLRLASLFK